MNDYLRLENFLNSSCYCLIFNYFYPINFWVGSNMDKKLRMNIRYLNTLFRSIEHLELSGKTRGLNPYFSQIFEGLYPIQLFCIIYLVCGPSEYIMLLVKSKILKMALISLIAIQRQQLRLNFQKLLGALRKVHSAPKHRSRGREAPRF